MIDDNVKKILCMIDIAVKRRDAKLVREFLELKPDLDSDYGGRMLSDALDDVEIATMLVQAGAKVNMSQTAVYKRHPSKYRFLHLLACRVADEKCKKLSEQYLQLAILIMDRGVNLNECDEDGDTALHIAVERGSIELTRELLKRGADVETTNNNNLDAIEIAINGIVESTTKTDVMLPLLIKSGNADEETIIRRGLKACKFSLYEFRNLTEPMKVLVDLGIPLHALDDGDECNDETMTFSWPGHKCTPLQYAVYYGYINTVAFLLKNGVDVNKHSKCGKIPIIVALYRDNPLTIEMLLRGGANIHNCNSDDGRYPIHLACEMRSAHSVKLLLNLGADLNVIDKKGKTPVALIAVQKRFDATSKTVIKHLALSFSKGIRINQDDLLIIRTHAIAKEYYEKCLTELRKMKATPLLSNISVFDIFVTRDQDVSHIVTRTGFMESFKNIIDFFPMYSENLENKIKLAKEIRDNTEKFYLSVFQCDTP